MNGFGQAAGAMLVGLAASGAARGETLDQAIAAARAGPRMTLARATYRAGVSGAAVAIAGSRPTVVFDATVTRNFDSDVYGPRLRDASTLQIGVPLYAGGRIRAGRAAARAGERAARASLDAAETRLAVDVANVYTAVEEARDLRTIAGEQVQRLQNYQRRIIAERRAGAADGIDSAQGTARLAAARRDLVDAERRLALAEGRYAEIVGHRPGDRLDGIAPAPALDADVAAAEARLANPELRSLRYSVEAATHDVEAQRGYGRPSLNLIARGSYGDTGTGVVKDGAFALTADGALQQARSPRRFPHRFAASGLLVLRIPFYSGGEASARVTRAQAVRAEAQAREDERERAIVAETRDAVFRSRAASADARLAAATVDAAHDALKGVDIGRSIGDRSELDVLDAARELADARSHRVCAEREAAMQALVALADTGRLAEALGTTSRTGATTASTVGSQVYFDLASFPDSHRETGQASAAVVRPLRYDLTGLG